MMFSKLLFLSSFGGANGIRDIAALDLAVNQPHTGFGDKM